MWISLSSLRQFVLGSAGMGSLLVVGAPAIWADGPNSQPHNTPQILNAQDSVIDQTGGLSDPGYSAPTPQSQRIVKPGYAVLPPPGTLGETYLRQSWPIPKEDHPRTAYIQIEAPGFTELQMEGLEDMEGFQRPDGIWIFKSDKPLMPGIAHIYQVKAGYRNSTQRQDVRTVRLIPGRVVTLEF